MNIVHTLSDLILIKKGKCYWWGHVGGLRMGIREKGLGRGKREEVLQVWKMVNGGRALVSFKFTTVYLIERTKYIICLVEMLLYIRNHKLSWL
jgi:hypothetical protein